MGVLKNILVGCAPKTRKIKKVTTSQDDDLVGVLKKTSHSKLALMGAAPPNVIRFVGSCFIECIT